MESISIVIPTKNEEKYLPRLLNSIERQSSKPLEVIIADAGSNDKTLQIVEYFEARIVQGGSPAFGRNNGAENARGDLLYFMDADTVMPAEFVKKTMEEFRKRRLDAAALDNYPVYIQGEKGFDSKPIRSFDKAVYFFHNYGQGLLSALNFPTATATCIISTKDMFNSVGGFKDIVFEDSEFALNTSKKGKFGILNSSYINVSTRRFDKHNRPLFVLHQLFQGLLRRFFIGELKSYGHYF